jgi:hypothetical protein
MENNRQQIVRTRNSRFRHDSLTDFVFVRRNDAVFQYSVQIYIVTENDPTNPEALDHRSNRPSLRVRMRTHY